VVDRLSPMHHGHCTYYLNSRLCRISAYFLAFYSAMNANNNVKMLLILSFAILLIIFELIDKSPVVMFFISRNDIFSVFKSVFGREAVSVQVSFLGYFPLLLWIKWKQGAIDFIFLFLLVFCLIYTTVQLIF
ncbi:hypothetical protein, partial [Aeromonas media]|uniref:hypothetical protein n=1 Tax=Aeromonas media TaxID=651 RepID=UPI001F2528AA